MKRPWKLAVLLFVAPVMAVVLGVLAPSGIVSAANPTTMSFQGKVVNSDGTNVTDNLTGYPFIFRIYSGGTSSSGGTLIWTESDTVPVAAGTFQVNLGATCNFFTATSCTPTGAIDFSTSNNLYMSIAFNGDTEMTPRVALQSVPYAFQADNASKLGGRDASGYVQLNPSTQQTGSINLSANGTFGGTLQGATITSTGALQGKTLAIQSATYTSNLALINNGQTTAPPAYPNAYMPTMSIITSETTGSRPLFFGYNNGTTYDAFLTAGACGAFTQMCLDLGTGANAYTALESVGTTLRVGGGDDGNFTTLALLPSGNVGVGAVPGAFKLDVSGTFRATGLATLSTTGATAVAVPGAPAASATSSLIQVGDALANGNALANGGTYIGINQPASGAGSAADFVNLQEGGDSKFVINNNGEIRGNGFDYFDPSLLGTISDIGINDATAGNFGGAISTGAFLGTNTYYSMDFVASTANASTTNNSNQGDSGNWYFNNNNQVSISAQTFSTAGGYFRMAAPATTNRGAIITTGATTGVQDRQISAANLPIIQMKVRTSVARATDDIIFGATDTQTATVTNDTLPANGLFFSSNNSTGTTGWQGIVRAGGATLGTPVTCPGVVTPNAFVTGRIIVVSSTKVRFYIDNDASVTGVKLLDCGVVTVTAGSLPTAIGLEMQLIHTVAATTTLDLDYARWWQDDAPTAPTDAPGVISSQETQADIATAADPGAVPSETVVDPIASVGPDVDSSVPTPSGDQAMPDSTSAVAALSDGSIQTNTSQGSLNFTFDSDGNTGLDGSLDLADASIRGGLIVNGDANFNGLSNFQKLATFFAKTIFKQDVQIDGHLSLGADNAGYAKIRTGESNVHVAFTKPYEEIPIVNANTSDGNFALYTIGTITKEGFDITLRGPAVVDFTFSWTAVGTNQPVTSSNPEVPFTTTTGSP